MGRVDVGNGRVLFVPATGADSLSAAVESETAGLGDEPLRSRFLGHITTVRLSQRAHMPPALGELVNASWEPREVALVKSALRPDGPRYDTLVTYSVRRHS